MSLTKLHERKLITLKSSLKPCSHSTLIMISGSIIQTIILHSILFNYGSVHICENWNTTGRGTSHRIVWQNGAVSRGCHDHHQHAWGEERTKDSFWEQKMTNPNLRSIKRLEVSSAHTTTCSPFCWITHCNSFKQPPWGCCLKQL